MSVIRLILILSHFCMLMFSGLLAQQEDDNSAMVKTVASQSSQIERVYSGYGRLLRIYADQDGMVSYESLIRDRELLRSAVADFGSVSQRDFALLGQDGQIALLINAYNLFAIDIVASNWPIKRNWISGWFYPGNSIRQLGGAFDEIKHQLLGSLYTLDDIERGMLLERYGDPRVHMALVCASKGCPKLRGSPYTADSLDAQLDKQARRFLSSAENLKIDRGGAEVSLSELFDWYADDWLDAGYTNIDSLPPVHRGKDPLSEEQRSVIEFVAGYLDSEQREYLEGGGYELEYLDYDWSLNARE